MNDEFLALNIAVLTVSDTRDEDSDTSGQLLVGAIGDAGHHTAAKKIVKDNIYQIRAIVSKWIADNNIDVIISTGGTGVTGRDSTPEAITALLDKTIEGFGELFRSISYPDIGASALQSRCVAGVANGTYIFCLPGSKNACATAWDKILKTQLDKRSKPCNFAMLISRLQEK